MRVLLQSMQSRRWPHDILMYSHISLWPTRPTQNHSAHSLNGVNHRRGYLPMRGRRTHGTSSMAHGLQACLGYHWRSHHHQHHHHHHHHHHHLLKVFFSYGITGRISWEYEAILLLAGFRSTTTTWWGTWGRLPDPGVLVEDMGSFENPLDFTIS